MSETVIGVLHPGEMGAAVGRCLAEAGHPVLWASEGRGAGSTARALAAGLADAGSVAGVARRADVILSICPPHAALDVAWAAGGFTGLYVDANAISPGAAREIAGMISERGGHYVDGGIIGLPPQASRTTRLYVSGPRGEEVTRLFAGTAVEARIVTGGAYSASAVKMAYAAWTKGSAALLLAARALARAEGVESALLAEWAVSQPHLADRTESTARSASAKGWRWVAEMEEIAASMAAAGLPDGFHQAAAEIFRRSPHHPAGDGLTSGRAAAEQVLDALLPDADAGRQ